MLSLFYIQKKEERRKIMCIMCILSSILTGASPISVVNEG